MSYRTLMATGRYRTLRQEAMLLPMRQEDYSLPLPLMKMVKQIQHYFLVIRQNYINMRQIKPGRMFP